MVIKIRQSHSHDRPNLKNLNILKELDRETFPNDAPCDFNGETYWWLVYHNIVPVAFAGLKVFEEAGMGRCGYLCRAGVIESFRGNGLQKKMIKLRDNKARRLGLETNITYTSYDNVASQNSLIKCGYLRYIPHFRWGRMDHEIYFMKKLI